MPLYSIHIHYFAEVLPRLFCRGIFKVAVALVFTAVLQIFTRGGREVGARGKDEVLPQPDGSILSGGTVGNRLKSAEPEYLKVLFARLSLTLGRCKSVFLRVLYLCTL